MATILVADDEPLMLGLVSMILERAGYRVVRASNGLEALLLYESYASRIDLVLTDIDMPQMNGVEMAHRILATHPGSKVVFMTGGLPDEYALPEGCPLVRKPFQANGLVGVVAQTMGARTGEDGPQADSYAHEG
jgi:CheY-like chemotaxis protein